MADLFDLKAILQALVPQRSIEFSSRERDGFFLGCDVQLEGKNIGDVDVLVGIAASVGLSSDAAKTVLEERSFKEAIDSDWARSRAYGITGVPTFVAGGYGVVGAQPYETLEQLLNHTLGAREGASQKGHFPST